MELYPMLVNLIVIAAILAGISFAIWWPIAFYRIRSREAEEQLPQSDVPPDIKEVPVGFPVALVVFFVIMGLSMIAYVLAVWLGGVTY